MVWVVIIVVGTIFILCRFLISNSEIKEMKKSVDEKIMSGEIEGFIPQKSIKDPYSNYGVYIDGLNKKIMFVNLTDVGTRKVFNFDELIECSILEDGAAVNSGGIGRAVVGGIIGGGVGAVVGATTRGAKSITRSLSVRIISNKISDPLYEIPIITCELRKDSSLYKVKFQFAQEVYATIVSAINSVKLSRE